MRWAPRHPEPPTHADAGAAPCQGRLNLLLSDAGWDEGGSWADRLPALLAPMGVEAVRVRTGKDASQVIQATPIHVAVVDLGLPLNAPADQTGPATHAAPSAAAAMSDQPEGGIKILELLRRMATPPPTVVIKRRRTARDDQREIAAALRAGAFAVLDRPRQSRDLELMLEVLRRLITRHYQGRWPTT